MVSVVLNVVWAVCESFSVHDRTVKSRSVKSKSTIWCSSQRWSCYKLICIRNIEHGVNIRLKSCVTSTSRNIELYDYISNYRLQHLLQQMMQQDHIWTTDYNFLFGETFAANQGSYLVNNNLENWFSHKTPVTSLPCTAASQHHFGWEIKWIIYKLNKHSAAPSLLSTISFT